MKGLGFIDAIACPHYNGEKDGKRRDSDFKKMVKKSPDIGIGIDDNCALEVIDGSYRVITSQEGAGAHKLYKQNRQLIIEQIEQMRVFAPISDLWRR